MDAVLALFCLAIGGLLVFFLLTRPQRTRLHQALHEREQERLSLQALREEHAGLKERAQRVPTLEEQNTQLRDTLQETQAQLAALEARLESERQSLEQKFHELAATTLQKNSDTFLQLVSERHKRHETAAKQELETRHKVFDEGLKEFRLLMGSMGKELHKLDAGQSELRGETGRLVQALRRPQTRGRWGEIQLRNVLEMAGMQEHADFLEQPTIRQEEGILRPDLLLNLPDGKHLIVDAKTPLDAYLSALEAKDEEERARHLSDHVRQFRKHIQDLSSKEYWKALPNTPDFVIMFVPGEAFFSVALEKDPGLYESALEKRVLLCTPTTFIALVKAIAYGWRQERFTENAQTVMRQARELHDRICVFVKHMDKLRNNLQKTVNAYNAGLASLETRVLPAARKFETLGAAPAQQKIDDLDAINTTPRLPLSSAAGGVQDDTEQPDIGEQEAETEEREEAPLKD